MTAERFDIHALPPPSAPHHEIALVGCCLAGAPQPDLRLTILCSVSAADFADKRCRQAIECVRTLVDEGEQVNRLTLQLALERKGLASWDQRFLDQLDFDLPDTSPSAVRRYVQEVRDARLCRELLDGAQRIAIRANRNDTEALTEAKLLLEHVQELCSQDADFSDVGFLAEQEVDRLDASPIGGASESHGILSGIPKLDQLTQGFRPGQNIIIAGRTGMGKSALVEGIAVSAAMHQKKPVAYFSLEMSKQENVRRALAQLSGIAHERIRSNHLNLHERHELRTLAKALANVPLFFEETLSSTIDEIERRAWTIQRERGCSMIVIDYVQLISVDSRAGVQREQEVARLSRGCKMMARSLGVPVLVLSQLSRECEKRDNKRPMLHDLRESGSLEQDADLVLFVYRDCVYNKLASQHDAEIIIGKQRDGNAGETVHCHFDGETMRFTP